MELVCPFGIFDDLSVAQVASNDTDCSKFTETAAVKDSCNIAKDPFLIKTFEACQGNTTCEVSFPKNLQGLVLPKPPC